MATAQVFPKRCVTEEMVPARWSLDEVSATKSSAAPPLSLMVLIVSLRSSLLLEMIAIGYSSDSLRATCLSMSGESATVSI